MFEKWHWTEQIRVDVDKVGALPEAERNKMVQVFENRIRAANYMLAILRDPTKTPTK
jgi:hypothetical protein